MDFPVNNPKAPDQRSPKAQGLCADNTTLPLQDLGMTCETLQLDVPYHSTVHLLILHLTFLDFFHCHPTPSHQLTVSQMVTVGQKKEKQVLRSIFQGAKQSSLPL